MSRHDLPTNLLLGRAAFERASKLLNELICSVRTVGRAITLFLFELSQTESLDKELCALRTEVTTETNSVFILLQNAALKNPGQSRGFSDQKLCYLT